MFTDGEVMIATQFASARRADAKYAQRLIDHVHARLQAERDKVAALTAELERERGRPRAAEFKLARAGLSN